jgi:hypothetical protein
VEACRAAAAAQTGGTRPGGAERALPLLPLIYLSDGYEGGETTFDVDGTLTDVCGERGDVVVFPHRLRHRGSVVTAGTKYMLRTDVMYYPLVGAGQSSFPSVDSVRAMNAAGD